MPVRYMLDTNTVSYLLRGKSTEVRQRMLRLSEGEEVCISVITEAEILYGLRKRAPSPELRSAIEAFLAGVDVVAWNSPAAKSYAMLRADIERRGVSLGNLDMLIAAHSIAEEAILVTNDRAFARVKGGLAIENWVG